MAEEGQSLKVFISYSRDDLAFADQLFAALEATGFSPTLDRVGISGAANWREMLRDLILKCDTIVFVLSPSSVDSEVCGEEVKEALGLAKRIIPVVCRPLGNSLVPASLQDLNYIFFYPEEKAPGSGFGAGLVRLKAALETDLSWTREHTRLSDRAADWDRANRPPNRLLTGGDIVAAKDWIQRKPPYAPPPTVLQREFISASETEERTRVAKEQDTELRRVKAEQDAERLRLETDKLRAEQAKELAEQKQRRTRLLLVAVLTLSAVLAAAALVWQRETTMSLKLAEYNAKVAKLEAEKAQNQINKAQPNDAPKLTDAEASRRISQAAVDLIASYEVSMAATNAEGRFDPVVPGGASGVTIGYGYDLGYNTLEDFVAAWKPHLPPEDITRLSAAIGKIGPAAEALLPQLSGVSIPERAAKAVLMDYTLPRFGKIVDKTFPNADLLSPDSYGALVSLVYNRGASLEGDRRREMKAIHDLMAEKNFAAIPDQFRAMKRLWSNSPLLQPVLLKRRDAEAELFEKGLAPKP